MTFKITYNAPVTLTFIALSLILLLLNMIFPTLIPHYFSIGGSLTISTPLDLLRLVTHVLGNTTFDQLFGSALLILLLGPILEDKYGPKKLIFIMSITAIITGVINVLLFKTALMGASSIVFSFIILSSIVNVKSGALPLTFLLIITIYIGREIVDILHYNHLSQIAPIIGGIVGASTGFWFLAKELT